MKRLLSLILVLICLCCFVGCKEKEAKVFKVIVPTGTPLLSIGGLLDDSEFNIEVVNGSDPLQAAFIGNDYDMIIAPLNLGAKLYMANNSKYLLEAIITTNNTYLISQNEYDVLDMNKKTVLAYGVGSTPYIALTAFNDLYNLDMTITPLNSGVSDVATSFVARPTEYDMYLLAEPNITILKEKNNLTFNTYNVAQYLDSEVSILIQACLFVNPKSNISKETLKKIEDNIASLNNNPTNYANSILNKNEYFTKIGADILAKSIPNCNITYVHASENLDKIQEYYQLLNKYVPKVLNGSEPNESFYNK